MGVTDAGADTHSRDESRNRERLAEAEAKMDKLLEAMGVDTSDEAQAQRRRDAEALRTAEVCGECGEPLGENATVYRLRFLTPVLTGRGYRTRVLCKHCAEHSTPPPKEMSLRKALRAVRLVEGGMSHEDAYREVMARNLIYHWCDACGRKVVFDMTKREREGRRKHVFCSERCARDSHRRIRNERNAKAREKVCELCGAEFTATRRDAKTCSTACKQKAYRRRRQKPEELL